MSTDEHRPRGRSMPTRRSISLRWTAVTPISAARRSPSFRCLAGSRFAHLAVQGGKDSKLRLVNLDNLSNGPPPAVSGRLGGEVGSIINVPQGSQVFAQPAVWINPVDDTRWVFVATAGGLSGLQLHLDGAGNPSLVSKWTVPQGGASPIVANNVLYYAGGSDAARARPGVGQPAVGQQWRRAG